MKYSIKREWFSNVRGDILSGLVVALALVPEAIAFSIIAGVDPKVGLYASFSIAVITAFTGGRPGMISAATGAMALLIVHLVKDHGLQYLLVATILTGILQVIAGYLKLGNLMRFVSRAVVTGFVNALAILIFMAQLPELTNVTWHVYAMTAAGLAIIYLFPFLPVVGKVIPSPLVTIVVLSIASILLGLDIRTVGDMGQLPDTLPVFLLPEVPLTLETLKIVLPYSVALAVVGILESLMTATIVDDLTDTTSDKNRECKGQGIANVATGFLGGMAGCAMIGQSVINVKSGGRTRLSTLTAGLLLLIMVVFLSDWLKQIPMAALVAVMIMVSIGTFSWDSLAKLKTYPVSTNIVTVATVVVVVTTHNLAIGVMVGILLAAMFFANKVGRYMAVTSALARDGARTYTVSGQVFFASAEKFNSSFDFKEVIDKVVIDLSRAHFWDVSAVAALDRIVIKFRREGTEVELVGMNEASSTIVDRFGVHDKPEEVEKLLASH
ncbi:MAG: SulP family inorganic anion transporter [Chlorobium sp.]|jgi:SulP family sulfate permease|uniref:SulP family inorganic anion transporter n=1 Tax=Chlorobium sp. TaxID=1095 RepID=UPI001DFBD9CE|nr:SulP family inorganic anion transporter [Chlorobium sp.]MBN1279058.1 SulP family inorganic anion transporter [Chlorobiaceae bacterium]MCF8216831.1 SulP family inorganic anion transporter [Chlorobium sp.]MCF8271676.1 SulP family inorganic anion transporter [Chlorobium sp.]MCF8288048.1 SulP family inorganic anion transporter [Chlorobium sp.]MCF8291632.1 SulP family inorganic anion transporter [Chlorobium sp.]